MNIKINHNRRMFMEIININHKEDEIEKKLDYVDDETFQKALKEIFTEYRANFERLADQ